MLEWGTLSYPDACAGFFGVGYACYLCRKPIAWNKKFRSFFPVVRKIILDCYLFSQNAVCMPGNMREDNDVDKVP